MTTARSGQAPGLAPTRSTLSNGAVLVAKETRTTPAVTINLAMRAGSFCDPPDAAGAMFLLSRVIDRGTASRSADAIAEELDGRGIALTANVSKHLFSIVCTCLAEDFEPVVALLADILMSPTLPEAELVTRRREVVTNIRQDEDNPAIRATETLMELLYPDGHPYGRRQKGTVEVVETLSRTRLLALHSQWFAPSQLSAVIVGDVDPARARHTVERAFDSWKALVPGPLPFAAASPAAHRRRFVIPMMNKAQADVAYGFTTLKRADPEYYAFSLMNHAFGQYSMSGRLGDSIRERQGMAYYVYSTLDANLMEGPLLIRAGVGPENVDRAVASIDEEVGRLVREGLTGKEVDDSRQYLIYSMPRSLETNSGIASFLQTAEFFGLGLDHDVRLPDLLKAVTLDQVNASARRFLDASRATVVIAGPYEERPV